MNDIMDNDKYKDLFDDFRPELTPDFSFIGRLEEKLDSVEFIREQQRNVARSNRRALAVAAAVGFAVGIVFMLIMPFISDMAANMQTRAEGNEVLELLLDNYQIIMGLVICVTSAFTALNAYEISLSLQRRKG